MQALYAWHTSDVWLVLEAGFGGGGLLLAWRNQHRLRIVPLLLLTLAGLLRPSLGRAATVNVPGDYPTIQDAVLNAPDGSAIFALIGSLRKSGSQRTKFPRNSSTMDFA